MLRAKCSMPRFVSGPLAHFIAEDPTMGRISIAAFRPHPGKEDELKRVIASRLPLLRRLGLSTDRTNITMRATDGTLVDASEWVDDAAIDRAHHTPEVLELWQRFDACCS